MNKTTRLHDLIDELTGSISVESRARILDKFENLELEDEGISVILDYVRQPPPNTLRSRAFLHVLDRIGFPRNKAALTYITSEAADINSANWELARDIAIRLGTNIISEVRNALRIYTQDCDEYNLYIQGLCQLLEDMEPDTSKGALPELLSLIEVGTDKNYVDEFALWPIKRIGSPNADAAIPIIAAKILAQDRSLRIRKESADALKHFDPMRVKPYLMSLLTIVRDYDKSTDMIHDLLNWTNSEDTK